MMKILKFLFSIVLFTQLHSTAAAQDRLVKVDGEMLQVAITEISDEVVKYKLFKNPDGPIFTNKLSMIHKIILETGDEFEYSPKISNSQKGKSPNPEISKNQSSNQQMGETDAEEKMNQSVERSRSGSVNTQSLNDNDWISRTSANFSSFNLDLNNLESDPELGVTSFMMEMITVNTFTRIGDFKAADSFLKHHGFVSNSSVRANAFTVEGQILMDFGLGYGIEYNSFSLYTTLNTTVYFWNSIEVGNETINDSTFFPSNASYLKLGVHWKPFLKRRLNDHNDRRTLGVHASINSYNGGNSVMIGLSF